MNWLRKNIAHIFIQSNRYICESKDEIAQENLLTLKTAATGFQLFLVCYGIWAFFAFKNTALNGFYLVYLVPNTVLMVIAIRGRKKIQMTFKRIQLLCGLYIFEVMNFIIGISVFPFPDRPSIFYSLGYTMMILIFQFTFLQMAAMLTVITGLFITLVFAFKDPGTIPYDLASSITTWILNVFILYAVNNLRIRNSDIRQELKRESQTDYLTGLLNRREMESLFTLLYRRGAALKKDISIFMLDIDNFKMYNDKYGHSAGDECIKYIGATLRKFIGQTGFFAARYGGEEFAIFLPECSPDEAKVYANQLLRELRFRDVHDNIITVSIGVACEIPQSTSTFSALLERADKALYRAKSEGRNIVVFD